MNTILSCAIGYAVAGPQFNSRHLGVAHLDSDILYNYSLRRRPLGLRYTLQLLLNLTNGYVQMNRAYRAHSEHKTYARLCLPQPCPNMAS